MSDVLITRIYEDNVLCKLSDDRFAKLSDGYEQAQRDLKKAVDEAETALQAAEQKRTDLRVLLKALREFTSIRELTPEIVNTLIRRIEVHSPEKKWGRGKVKVDIYFTAVGLNDLPTEREIKKLTSKNAAQSSVKTA